MKTNDVVLVRAPQPSEGVVVSGWGLADGLRRSLKGNPDLDFPGIHAALERLELHADHIATEVAPKLHLIGPDGPLDTNVEMCWPSTGVFIKVTNTEGVLAFLDKVGITSTYVAVDRAHLGMLEDPWSYWPDAQDSSKAADSNHLFGLLRR